jgi:hypothetical protein
VSVARCHPDYQATNGTDVLCTSMMTYYCMVCMYLTPSNPNVSGSSSTGVHDPNPPQRNRSYRDPQNGHLASFLLFRGESILVPLAFRPPMWRCLRSFARAFRAGQAVTCGLVSISALRSVRTLRSLCRSLCRSRVGN